MSPALSSGQTIKDIALFTVQLGLTCRVSVAFATNYFEPHQRHGYSSAAFTGRSAATTLDLRWSRDSAFPLPGSTHQTSGSVWGPTTVNLPILRSLRDTRRKYFAAESSQAQACESILSSSLSLLVRRQDLALRRTLWRVRAWSHPRDVISTPVKQSDPGQSR